MDATALSAIAGTLLSLAFSYIPGLNDTYSTYDSQKKSLIMLGLLVLVALGAYGAGCLGWWDAVQCTKEGALELGKVLFAAAVANQVTYQLSPSRNAKPVVAPVTPPPAG